MCRDLSVIISDPEWSDAQTFRYISHEAGVTLLIALKLLGWIIDTAC